MNQVLQRSIEAVKEVFHLDPPLSGVPSDAPRAPLDIRALPSGDVLVEQEAAVRDAEKLIARLNASAHYRDATRLQRAVFQQRQLMLKSRFCDIDFTLLRREIKRLERTIPPSLTTTS